MTKKVYVWHNVDFGLYAPGFAIAIADSFGEACEIAANSGYGNKDELKNKLLVTSPEVLEIDQGFGYIDEGHD